MPDFGLRAAIIGLGVGERHIEGFESDPRCKVVALCDIDPAKLAEVGGRHPGRRLTTDPTEVLSDPDIDVVSVASYDDAHRDQVVAALSAGKHVFVEKPLCLTAGELDDIARALDANPRLRLSSNLILRRSPLFANLREALRAGAYGTPYYLEGDYNYGRVHKITEGWRGKLADYSVFHSGAIHVVDLMVWMLGELPVEATAMGTNLATRGTAFRKNDLIAAFLKFPSGAVAKVTANFACVHPHFHNFAVYGTEASFLHGHAGSYRFTSRDPAVAPARIADPYPGVAKGDMLPAFVRAILDGGEPEISERDVLDVMAVSLAVEEALGLGKPVDIRYVSGHFRRR